MAQRIAASSAVLGEGMTIRRALPNRTRRLVGPWCFLDHFGPADVATGKGLRVGPHPHTGLQTVTWLIEGEILHRDSLGFVQPVRPGQLNLMTSGAGISHSEESPAARPPRLHGVQLWIALPAARSEGPAAFMHAPELPARHADGARLTVFAGACEGLRSPAELHSPALGAELLLTPGARRALALEPGFEHAVLLTEGEAIVAGEALGPGTLLYLGRGRRILEASSAAGARLVLIGGEPLGEDVLIWWNFVGRSRAAIIDSCKAWNAGDPRFGEVRGYDGERLPAPLPPWAG